MKNNKELWIGVVLLSLIAFVITFYIIYDVSDKDESVNKETQSSQKNEVVEDNNTNLNENYEQQETIIEEKNVLNYIEVSKFFELVNNKEKFVILFSQTTCGHCTLFKPKLNKVALENDLLIYVLEYNLLSDEDKMKVMDIVHFTSTPTLVFMENGNEISPSNRISGNKDISFIINRFVEMGYINSTNVDEDMVVVDDYVGKNYLNVKADLESKGLYVFVERTNDYPDDIGDNIIVKQSVEVGTKLKKGSSITLFVPNTK